MKGQLIILAKSLWNICEEVYFSKICKPKACNFTKNELLQSCFPRIFPTLSFFFMNTFFKEHIWMAASGLLFYFFAQYEQKEEY